MVPPMDYSEPIRKPFLLAVSAVLVLVALTSFGASAAIAGEPVTAWSYYMYPPFQDKRNDGLNHDLLRLMEEASDGKFRFHLELMPRKRIEYHMAQGDPGIVLFISPKWLTPPGNEFAWSAPLFADRNGILFSGLRVITYEGPKTLYGMSMGGVVGRKYRGLDEAVEEGRIIREDTVSEELNLLKLAEGRIDFMTAPESSLRYLVHRLKVGDKVSFSPTPLFEYTRHILVYNTTPEVREFVLDFVHNLPTNPAWQELKKKYQLQ